MSYTLRIKNDTDSYETITFQSKRDYVRVLKAYRVMRSHYLRTIYTSEGYKVVKMGLSREQAKKIILDLLFAYVTNWQFADGEVLRVPRHKVIPTFSLKKG